MRNLKIVTISVVCILLISFAIIVSRKVQLKLEAEKNTQHLPLFAFVDQNGAIFNNEQLLQNNRSCLVFYFEPDCEYCQNMTTSIVSNKNKFTDYDLLFITVSDSITTGNFSKKYELEKQGNISLLRDKKHQFSTLFGTSSAPTFFVYNSRKALVRKIIGETKIERLLD